VVVPLPLARGAENYRKMVARRPGLQLHMSLLLLVGGSCWFAGAVEAAVIILQELLEVKHGFG